MPGNIGWLGLVTPSRPVTSWGDTFSDLIKVNLSNAQRRLEEQQLAENARQFGVTNTRLQTEADAEHAIQRASEEGQNRRFATGQANVISEKNEADARKRYDASLALAAQTRQLLAHGKYAEAMSNIGTLRDQGVDANVSSDDQGNPVFHIAAPKYTGPELSGDFSTFLGQVSPHSSSMSPLSRAATPGNATVPPPPPQPSGDSGGLGLWGRNPFDTTAGTLSGFSGSGMDSTNPYQQPQGGPPQGTPPPPSPTAQPPRPMPAAAQSAPVPPLPVTSPLSWAEKGPLQMSPEEQAQMNARLSAGGAASTQPQPTAPRTGAPPVAQAQGDLSTSELSDLNARALSPVMSGINQAFVPRYQGNAQSLTNAMMALHDTPEGTLAAMEPILKNATSNWNAEMAAEAQANKVAAQTGGQAATEDRLRENAAREQAEKVSKERGLPDDVKAVGQFDEIREKLRSGNRNAQGDAVKQLIALREGHRISDADYKLGLEGVISKFGSAQNALERIYHDGLPTSSYENMMSMVDMAQKASKTRIADTQKQLKRFAGKYRNESERYAVKSYIQGAVPENMLDPDMANWDPSQDQGGNHPAASGSRGSVSVTQSSAGGQAPAELSPEQKALLDRLLK